MNYGPQEAGTSAARPMTPVEAAASECADAQHRLTAMIEQLAERLSMVLSPAVNKVGEASKPEVDPPSLLVSFLRENHNRTQSHVRRLEELLDRLTI